MMSCAITGIGMFLFATTNYMTEVSNMTSDGSINKTVEDSYHSNDIDTLSADILGWTPLISVILVGIGYHLGLSPIIWSYTGMAPLD